MIILMKNYNSNDRIPFKASALASIMVFKFKSLGPSQDFQELGKPVLFSSIHFENRYISAK